MIKLKLICFNGNEHHIECERFEFRTNQVDNWFRYTDENDKKIHIPRVAVIKTDDDYMS
jgi:hypothetical protein